MLNPWPIVTSSVASGRANTAVATAIAVPSSQMSPRSSGNTSRPRIRNSAELGDPGQPVVEGDDRAPRGRGGGAEHEPREVDRQEAGAVQRVGGAVGERRGGDRGDGVQARGGQPHGAQPLHAERADAEPDDEADAELLHRQQQRRRARPKSGFWIASMQPITSRIAIGSLMPDSPSSVRARRRRSVDPRRTANTAAASVAATVEPSSSAGSGSRSRISAAADGRQRRGHAACRAWRARSRSSARAGSRRSRWRARPRTGSAPRR